MPAVPNPFVLSLVQLDRDADTPLYDQLYDDLRRAIIAGQLTPGVRLPSSREFADRLGVSRNTVLNAVNQLRAEGYLAARIGSGTYVAADLPEQLLATVAAPAQLPDPPDRSETLAASGQRFDWLAKTFGVGTGTVASGPPRHRRVFAVGTPDLDAFPFDLWAQLTGQQIRYLPLHRFAGEQGSYPLLQAAIADHLSAARAVRCTPEQVILTVGSQHALHLAATVLLDAGDALWIENPSYGGARSVFFAHGARLVPVPVDRDGMDVAAGITAAPDARLVYVTPSHQFPLGVTMSLPRRLELLDWAQRAGAWVIEDDYDSEYRYGGRPLAALQGLDAHHRVIYVGTFSKVLFPALRLGYLIVPPDLVPAFNAARWTTIQQPPLVEQAVTAAFMVEGHFTRHLRRMRNRYAAKRAALLEALTLHFGQSLRLLPTDCGMHLTMQLPAGVDDQAVSRAAWQQGIAAPSLAGAYLRASETPDRLHGLILGYAGATEDDLRAGAATLARVVTTEIVST